MRVRPVKAFLAFDAAQRNRIGEQALETDFVATVGALLYLAGGKALLRRLDFAQLAHVPLCERVFHRD